MVVAPRPLVAILDRVPEPVTPVEDPQVAELAARGLESARGAGAVYADVRLTYTRTRRFLEINVSDEEDMEVGVRALVDGYWGFASGPVWSPDEMARLGREAVHQAKVNTLGKPRDVDLASVPVVQNAHWTTPVQVDPFALSPFEVQDYLAALRIWTEQYGVQGAAGQAFAIVQDEVFSSTIGSYCTQRRYWTEGTLSGEVHVGNERGGVSLPCLSRAGMGWELFTADRIPRVRDHSLRDELRLRAEESRALLKLPLKPIDVGRYDAAVDATSMARFVDATLGRATELDRALGYEANAGGTSYLSDPSGMIGHFQAGAPLLTVTANRSEPGAAATVQWDDEGVTADDFPLVKKGVLTDFQTTRESAAWLAGPSAGAPARSHGCADAPSAMYAPMTHIPNLVMAPGTAGDFEAMVSSVTDGLAITGANLEMDFQVATGFGTGTVVAVKNGKRVARLSGAGFLFRSTEFWKSLMAIGGETALRRVGAPALKGEPPQVCYHSVTAPPAVVKGLTLIDPLRKA